MAELGQLQKVPLGDLTLIMIFCHQKPGKNYLIYKEEWSTFYLSYPCLACDSFADTWKLLLEIHRERISRLSY